MPRFSTNASGTARNKSASKGNTSAMSMRTSTWNERRGISKQGCNGSLKYIAVECVVCTVRMYEFQVLSGE